MSIPFRVGITIGIEGKFFDSMLAIRYGVLRPGFGFVVNANIVQFFQFIQDFFPFFRRQKHCFALLIFVHDILRMYPNYDAPLQSPTPLSRRDLIYYTTSVPDSDTIKAGLSINGKEIDRP